MSSVSSLEAANLNENSVWRKSFLLPAVLLAVIGIILVPLPPMVMDLLISFNLTLSVLILLTTIFVRKPLDFSAFPTVLLVIVMLRLGLNIASTRLILSRAEEDGTQAAGFVIQAFSDFVTSGNLVVGVILFLIILIIQFVVITKGAGRISEVSARFTLDGLPGKQMAIDAELQAGAISQEEAQRRRLALGDEVDFYGAMDGASKFVRGDAVAGLAITFVNVLGGLAIGLSSGNHTLAETAETYTRLTVGDGLVSQLPAFLVAIGSAMLVTRSNREKKLAEEFHHQLFSQPVVLAVTGLFLFAMMLTHLPKLPLLILGSGCELLAAMLYSDAKKRAAARAVQEAAASQLRAREEAREAAQVRLTDAIQQEAIELELGADLAVWTEPGNPCRLLEQVQAVRRNLAREFGFLMPAVRITSAEELDGNAYRIRISGSTAAEQVLRPEMLLAVEGIYVSGSVDGLQTKEPVQHRPAVWVVPKLRAEAEEEGYEILTPCQVLTRHLTELVLQFAPELLTHDDVQNLLDELAKTAPATVRDVVPALLSVQDVQRVLQRLLAERIPIRSLGQILETLGRASGRTRQPIELTEAVRGTLGRLITSRQTDPDGILHVLTLAPALETWLTSVFELTEDGLSVFADPMKQSQFVKQLSFQAERQQLLGVSVVLLVSPQIRPVVSEIAQSVCPRLPVLSFAEVPKNTRVEQAELLDLPAENAGSSGENLPV